MSLAAPACPPPPTHTGVGGFSTPMALATPMLVSLGHDPLSSLVAVVCLNGLAAHLGEQATSYVSKQSSMTCNMPASFWVLQPQLMHDYLEHEACSYPTGCASTSGAYLLRQTSCWYDMYCCSSLASG
jgi:hypothetical protein